VAVCEMEGCVVIGVVGCVPSCVVECCVPSLPCCWRVAESVVGRAVDLITVWESRFTVVVLSIVM
jgi:hypothetical protein